MAGTCFESHAILERATKCPDTAEYVTPPSQFPSRHSYGPRRTYSAVGIYNLHLSKV